MVPKIVANKISIKERCSSYNVDILKREANSKRLFWDKKRSPMLPNEIVQGEEYEKLLRNDDYVLFNKQPSLSKDSLMAFRVKIRKEG